MRVSLPALLVAHALLAAAALGGCRRSTPEYRPSVSDRAQDPGAVPTADLSFEMLGQPDPAARRVAFRQLLQTLKQRCSAVTEAVLKGGFEGTDLWRVTCVDSGEWLVTFAHQADPVATSCKAAPTECADAWRSVAGAE